VEIAKAEEGSTWVLVALSRLAALRRVTNAKDKLMSRDAKPK
jgi:hypothetical protein